MMVCENETTLRLKETSLKEKGLLRTGYQGWLSHFGHVQQSPSKILVVLVLPLLLKKLDKMDRLIIDGKVTLVDDEGKPLTKGLLEQWNESYANDDYDFDPYDDDMYEV
ncbi:hypothetical protein Tco_1190279 [Tanacetum coccineum]